MKKYWFTLAILLLSLGAKSQLYFPPATGTWDTLSPNSLGWCQPSIDSLYDYLENQNTKAFILLVDGKIVLEKYFNGHSSTANWYWASAGKSLTAFTLGIAQSEYYLSINDTTSDYLGQGWTNCTPAQEEKITLRHQLTMTSGLDDGVADPFCTEDTCLVYKADPATRWAYHNGPYTLLDGVIENATGQTLNTYTQQKVKSVTGMDGLYLPSGYNHVFFSTARSMARFGLLALNHGIWNNDTVLADSTYFYDMVHPSQSLNEAYGYLWWLNGGSNFMVPQSQTVFPGSICPSAPADMYAAMGKNGQFINVVPSQNMVWIRMGEEPNNLLVPFLMNENIWGYINALECNPISVAENHQTPVNIYPNPAHDYLMVDGIDGEFSLELINLSGQSVGKWNNLKGSIKLPRLTSGSYFLLIKTKESVYQKRLLIE